MSDDLKKDVILDKLLIKENIRNNAGKCTIMLLVLSLFTYLFAIIVINILKIRCNILGINISEDSLILGIPKEEYNFLLGYLPCIVGDIAAIVVGLKINCIRLKQDLFRKNEGSFRFIMLGSISCISIGMISSTIYLIYSMIIQKRGLVIPSPDFSMPSSTGYIILFFLYTCILAPVFEEIIFRGIVLKSLMKYGNLNAIIVSSILFSLFHFNLVQLVNPILMGIVFSFITIKSKSIKGSIIAHMFNNSSIMMMTFTSNLNNNSINYLFSFIYLFGGLLGFLYFIKDYGKEFLVIIRENNHICSTVKKVWYSFTSIWSLLYIIIYLALVSFNFVISNVSNTI